MKSERAYYYPITLCYHGIAQTEAETDRWHVLFEEFKRQVNYLTLLGYRFVSPSDFSRAITQESFTEPLASIHFDDGFESVEIAAEWLIGKRFPFGIAVITKKIGQSGYLSWEQLNSFHDSGFFEAMYHTHDSHHTVLTNKDNRVAPAPMLEGPAWLDDGQFLYMDSQDSRLPYAASLLDQAWSFPLFGTDSLTKQPIMSKIEFTAIKPMKLTSLRLWACFSSSEPAYKPELTISFNGKIVFAGSCPSWEQGEFNTLHLDTPVELAEGERYTFTFLTNNSGDGLFSIYALPYHSDGLHISTDHRLADFPPDTRWPASPAIILATGNGRDFTEEQFTAHVSADLLQWKQMIPESWTVSQAVYPFGAYYSLSEPQVQESGSLNIVHPALKTALAEHGLLAGWSCYPDRLDQLSRFREKDMRRDRYALPRFPVYGNVKPEITLAHIAFYIGNIYVPVVSKEKLQWQTSVEYDPAGTSAVRFSDFDHIAWDAFYFREDGEIEEGAINPEDLERSRLLGNTNVLIFSNYDFSKGMPNGDLAWEVLHWPEQYLEKMEKIITDGSWDGAYLNLEWVFPSDREELTDFVKKLAARMHRHGKVLHITVPAITGTDYDYAAWTDAFDYTEIIRHVDAMKIMTYTEAVDDLPPQPHAPDWFFEAVYDYADKVIPQKDRKKLFIGANAFGRIWTTETTSDGETITWGRYASYHECLAEAIQLGAAIEKYKDGEGYWEKDTGNKKISCYFGTPDTVRRAVTLAKKKGYLGVGLWKADDGDLFEHYPRR